MVTIGDCGHNIPKTTMKLINKYGRNCSQRHETIKAATSVTGIKHHFFLTIQDVLPFSIIPQKVLRPQSHQLTLLIPLLKKKNLEEVNNNRNLRKLTLK